MSATAAGQQRAEIERASTLELFLDLVFVFTVTQLTELVSHPHGLGDYGRAALILAMTFWMYDGYVWLTGNLTMGRIANRLGIIAGMAGFLVMALAIPGVFGATETAADGGVAFGVAYLGVTLVHALMFKTVPTSSARAIRRIAPYNLAGAALVLAAGFVDEERRWAFWVAAAIAINAGAMFGSGGGWAMSAAHFVERHGLVIIVALGESIIAIGVGAAGLPIDGGLTATALLALALSATMWWVYFDKDDESAVAVMRGATDDRRPLLGLRFAYSHVVMIAGIVVMAAGVKSIVAHPTEAAETAAAWNLAAGVAIYILGDAAFRHSLGLGPSGRRLIAAALVLLTVPVGLAVSGVAHLAAVVGLMLLLIGSELRRDDPRPERKDR